jgi:uncharacterized protein (DUF2252 family)
MVAARATMDTLDVWYQGFTTKRMLGLAESANERAKAAAEVKRAEGRDSRELVDHATERVAGELRIRDEPPLVYHQSATGSREDLESTIRQFFSAYRSTLPDDRRALFDRFRLVDVAVRVVGVGSVGTRCYVALFVADGDCPLFLQIKEARGSVLEAYLPKSAHANHGERIVTGQHLMQSASDIFLGWSQSKESGSDFYVRQLRDRKGSFDIETFTPRDLDAYSELCAIALGGSMSKAGDPAPIAGYVGKSQAFDSAIERFAFAYADLNEADWNAFRAAVKAGRFEATDA